MRGGLESKSSPTNVRGRELTHASASVNMVSISVRMTDVKPSVFLRALLTPLTIISKNPPHHGALGQVNFHFGASKLYIFDNSEAALGKLLKLSDIIIFGRPRLATNFLKAKRKSGTLIDSTNSK